MQKRVVGKRPMAEVSYRESRIARALGDPSKFAIVDLLLKRGPLDLSDISHAIHRSESTVCHHLSKLKNLEMVRYETREKGVVYWIKYPEKMKSIMDSLEAFVEHSQKNAQKETHHQSDSRF